MPSLPTSSWMRNVLDESVQLVDSFVSDALSMQKSMYGTTTGFGGSGN